MEKINVNEISLKYDDFKKYFTLLVEENSKYNLTNITEEKEVFIKHFADSIYMNKIIDIDKIESICDIGSGAGFPSLPLKIVYPHLKVMIIEPTLKRVNFMKMVVEMLGLKDVTIINGRAEDVIKDYRETFDIVTARALAQMPMFLELTMAYAKKGGFVIAYKGSNWEEEVNNAQNALKVLNGEVIDVKTFDLDYDFGSRTLIKVLKKEKTNIKYPRRFSEIKKKTL